MRRLDKKTLDKVLLNPFMKLTAAGLSGIFTRFPFNPYPAIAEREQSM